MKYLLITFQNFYSWTECKKRIISNKSGDNFSFKTPKQWCTHTLCSKADLNLQNVSESYLWSSGEISCHTCFYGDKKENFYNDEENWKLVFIWHPILVCLSCRVFLWMRKMQMSIVAQQKNTNVKKIHFFYIYVALIWEPLKYSVQMFSFLKIIYFLSCVIFWSWFTFSKLSILHFPVFYIWATKNKKSCGWQN